MLDVVLLEGSGGVGSLKFGNRKPNSTTPLYFDIGQKHLKDCVAFSKGGGKEDQEPTFTVQR